MNSWRRTNLDELKNSTAWPLELFLDDGGVLNDNSLRGPEWLRLIGEFMPARLGGTAEQWASANRVVFSQVWGDLQKRLPTSLATKSSSEPMPLTGCVACAPMSELRLHATMTR